MNTTAYTHGQRASALVAALIMIAIVAGLDLGFARAVVAVFG